MKNPTGYELADNLLDDAERLLAHDRHAESVMAMARALEVTLAAATAAVLLSVGDESKRATPPEIEMLRKRYMTTIGNMSLSALRNVMIALVTRNVRPQSIAEALEFIEQAKRYGATAPAREHFAAIEDPAVRETMAALRDTPVISLCCAVVHQKHQPAKAEVEEQRDAVAKILCEIVTLFRLEAATTVR